MLIIVIVINSLLLYGNWRNWSLRILQWVYPATGVCLAVTAVSKDVWRLCKHYKLVRIYHLTTVPSSGLINTWLHATVTQIDVARVSVIGNLSPFAHHSRLRWTVAVATCPIRQKQLLFSWNFPVVKLLVTKSPFTAGLLDKPLVSASSWPKVGPNPGQDRSRTNSPPSIYPHCVSNSPTTFCHVPSDVRSRYLY